MSFSERVIYFGPGNGFPALTYSKMLNALEQKGYRVCWMDKMGHNPDFPITPNWPYLVDELIADIERQSQGTPVISVGHSMSGVLAFMAAVRRPDLFQALVTLDSFLLSPWKLGWLHVGKYLGWTDRITPAHLTKKRRNHWATQDDFLHYLQKRAFFQAFDPDCLADYAHYGLKQDTHKKGYTLAFEREREYEMYRTLPHTFSVFQSLQPEKRVPGALIYGEKSHLLKPADIRAVRKYYHLDCFSTPGTHMFPVEHPLACADRIDAVIQLFHIA